jgi:hypothetical protein
MYSLQDYTAFTDASHPHKYIRRLRHAAVLALSWATVKRLKNIAQLSLGGLAVVAADFEDNPSGYIFGAHLGTEKARLDPTRKGMADEVNAKVFVFVYSQFTVR